MRRMIPLIVLAITVAVAGCASDKATKSPPTFATTVVSAPPVRTGILGTAQSLGCASDLETLQAAIDSFFAINGHYPTAEAELVQTGILSTDSKFHDIGPDGTIVPSPTGGCTK